VAEREPTTEELRVVQSRRKQGEADAARESESKEAERAHRRRSEKAAYLEEKLAEQERSDDS